MASDPYELTWQEAVRSITQQLGLVDGLRTRTASLFSVASVVSTIFAALALGEEEPLGLEGGLAIAAYVGVAVMCLVILWPWDGWTFELSPARLLADYVEADNPASLQQMHRDLALHLESHYSRNRQLLDRLFWCYQMAILLVSLEVVLWLIKLTGG